MNLPKEVLYDVYRALRDNDKDKLGEFIDMYPILKTECLIFGETGSFYCPLIFHAFLFCNIETFKFLLNEKGLDINVLDRRQNNILFYWIEYGARSSDIEDFLLSETSVNFEYIRPRDGRTILHDAACRSSGELIKLLRRVNVIVNANAIDSAGDAPLHCMFKYMTNNDPGQMATACDWLISKGANVNAINNDGMTPLHCIVRYAEYYEKKDTLVSFLLQNGARPSLDVLDNSGVPPLLYCSFQTDLELTPHLMTRNNINAFRFGRSFLSLAIPEIYSDENIIGIKAVS